MTVDTPGSQSALRMANQQRVLRAVRAAGSLTQTQIARTTGLSAATVSNIVRELRETGVVEVAATSSNGRRAQSVSLAGASGYAVGVQVTATHLRAAVGDMAYQILAEEDIRYDAGQSAERGLRRAEWLVTTLLRQARVDRSRVRGLTLALPDPVAAGAELAGWHDVDVAADFGEAIGLPVDQLPDAAAAAVGEMVWGAGREAADVVYLNLSTSVGAALILGGQVYEGHGGLAGQLGHITVNEHGRICHCGNRGCLETVVGAPYLTELLPRRSDGMPPSLEQLVDAALAGDLGSRRAIADAGHAAGTAAALVCNLLNPQRFVVGGELADAGDLLLDPMRDMISRHTLPNTAAQVTVSAAELAGSAAARGAMGSVVRSAALHHDDAAVAL